MRTTSGPCEGGPGITAVLKFLVKPFILIYKLRVELVNLIKTHSLKKPKCDVELLF